MQCDDVLSRKLEISVMGQNSLCVPFGHQVIHDLECEECIQVYLGNTEQKLTQIEVTTPIDAKILVSCKVDIDMIAGQLFYLLHHCKHGGGEAGNEKPSNGEVELGSNIQNVLRHTHKRIFFAVS